MTRKIEKLEMSAQELDLIAGALETQSKILGMQASAGGHGALARLNEIKRVMATVSAQREKLCEGNSSESRWSGLLRGMGHAI